MRQIANLIKSVQLRSLSPVIIEAFYYKTLIALKQIGDGRDIHNNLILQYLLYALAHG